MQNLFGFSSSPALGVFTFKISKSFQDFKIISRFQNHFKISKSFQDFKIISRFQNHFKISKSFQDFKIISRFQNHLKISKSLLSDGGDSLTEKSNSPAGHEFDLGDQLTASRVSAFFKAFVHSSNPCRKQKSAIRLNPDRLAPSGRVSRAWEQTPHARDGYQRSVTTTAAVFGFKFQNH